MAGKDQKENLKATAPFAQRISRLRTTMKATGEDAVVILNLNNIRYLSGFSGSDGALLVEKERVVLLVDGRYTTQAGIETDAEVSEYRNKAEGIVGAVFQSGLRIVGIEAEALSYPQYVSLKEKFGEVQLKPWVKELETIRSIKGPDEISCLRRAAAIASSALVSLFDFIKPGLEEKALALELDYRMRKAGSDGSSFETIFASGPNAALPHAKPGRRKVADGDFIVIDYGATSMGYHSDETSTVALGQIDDDQKRVYGIVKDAHDRALEGIRAGVPGRKIDQIARAHIAEQGFGAFFSHGTGHGAGLEVHEPPRIAESSDTVLEAGMVVTVEPGIYIPGKWGVRIEDLVLVMEDGYEILSRVSKDLHIL